MIPRGSIFRPSYDLERWQEQRAWCRIEKMVRDLAFYGQDSSRKTQMHKSSFHLEAIIFPPCHLYKFHRIVQYFFYKTEHAETTCS